MDAERFRARGGAIVLTLAVGAGALVFLLQACFGPATPPPAPPAPPRFLSSPEALAPFFAALGALEDRQTHQPVRVLQIGDSHTAADALSGRMRERLQARFGASGRGWMPAGVPYRYYRPRLVDVSESGWQHLRPSDHAGTALGFDAVAAQSQPPEAVMAIESTEPAGFDKFAVEYLSRPDGSAFTVSVDGAAPIRVSTATADSEIKDYELNLDRPARQVELRTAGRPPVELLAWSIERQAPGIIYENHGTIGATIGLLGQMTPQAVAFELDTRRPALLIVAFGTNEGFDDSLDPARYAGLFHAQIAALQRRAHGAPILLLGTPDGNRVAHGCPATPCGAGGSVAAGDCGWREPEKLAAVRDLQRRLATQRGWAYWDWFGAMGGTCSIDRMASAQPPLAASDHVHLTKAGYEAMADLLFGDLMREYEKWKARPRTS
jgi:lysophospholipase L1-like esterase